MTHYSKEQQHVLNNFSQSCKFLIETGFAYAAANPQFIHHLECEKDKIEMIEREMKLNPRKRQCYERSLRDAYVSYMGKLTKLSLKYVNDNPMYYNEILKVQKVLNELDRMRNAPPPPPTAASTRKNQTFNVTNRNVPVDNEFEQIYNEINNLNRTISSLQNRTYNLTSTRRGIPAAAINRTSNCLTKFRREIEKKLNEVRDKRQSRRAKFAEMDDISISPEETQQFDIDDGYERDDENSSLTVESSSEVIVNCENFQPCLKIGRIEKHLIIPVQTDEPYEDLKVTPRVYMKRHDDGSMRMNVKLNFGERLMCNNKLVNSINIQNLISSRNYRQK